jgi:hypothetical protein
VQRDLGCAETPRRRLHPSGGTRLSLPPSQSRSLSGHRWGARHSRCVHGA